MATKSLVLRLLSASVCAANRAGTVIREVLSTGQLSVVDKGGNDPQTEADRKAQRCIVSTLSTRFPGLNIIGEETLEASPEDQELFEGGDDPSVLAEACPPGYTDVVESDLMVWVDPLDGTSEFTQGFIEHVTVLIGIALRGKAIAGIIHQPFVSSHNSMGRTIWGMVGLGVRGANITTTPRDGLRVVMTRSHYTDMCAATIEALSPTEQIREGGCGNKVLMVLEGGADVYVFPSRGTKKWDSCAGDAIVKAAGGMFTDIHGVDIGYDTSKDKAVNETGLLVTMDKELHTDIVTKIPQNVRDTFCKI